MKRFCTLLLAAVLLVGCGPSTPFTSGLPNPVREVASAQDFSTLDLLLDAPDGAENQRYSIIDKQIAQVDYEKDGVAYTARAAHTDEDISGVYDAVTDTLPLKIEADGAELVTGQLDHFVPDGSRVLFRMAGVDTQYCIYTKANLEESDAMALITDFLAKISGSSGGGVQTLTAAEAKAMMDSGDPLTILDVRTAEEYAGGHVPGALNLPVDQIDTAATLVPDKTAPVLLYCRSGARAGVAAQALVKAGYTQVYNFGGIINWPYETVQ